MATKPACIAGAPSPPAPRLVAPSSGPTEATLLLLLFVLLDDNDEGRETLVAATKVKYSPAPISLPLLLLAATI